MPEPSPPSTWINPDGGRWALQDVHKTDSPRVTAATTGPEFDVYSHDQAVLDLLKDLELELIAPMQLEPIESWARLNGSDLRVGLAKTTLVGKPAVLFLSVKQERNSDTYSLYGLLEPR